MAGTLMGLTNPIGTGQVAANLKRYWDEAVTLGLTNCDPLGDLASSSKDELRTALVFFADLSHEAGAGSREFNIAYIDLFPESGVKWKHTFNLGASGAEVSLSLIDEVWFKQIKSIFHGLFLLSTDTWAEDKKVSPTCQGDFGVSVPPYFQ
jgi:hypothetical protein